MTTKPMISLNRVALGLVLLAGSAQAIITVNWGSSIAGSGNLVDNAGNPLNDRDTAPLFQFELGYFSGTNPSGSTATWRDQWTGVDTAELNSSLGFFSSSALLEDNLAGEKLFLWVNNGDFTGTEDGEWALVSSSDWVVPDGGGGQKNPVLELSVTDEEPDPDQNFFPADEAFFGQVEDEIGAGRNTEEKPPGAVLQTYIVPEPSSVFLILLGSVLGLRRKR